MARTFIQFFIFLLLGCSALSAFAQPVMTTDGPFQIMTAKADNRVVIVVIEKKTSGQDMATFDGPCAPTIDLTAATGSRKNLKAFQASGNFPDLEIDTVVNRFREVLVKECPNVQHIKVTSPDIEQRVSAEMKRSEGWVLRPIKIESIQSIIQSQAQQGQQARAQQQTTIENGIYLAFSDALSNAAVNSVMACEANVTIPLMRAPTGRKEARMTDFRRFSTEVAAFYSQRCPSNQSVRFIVETLPEDVSCPSGECYISTEKPEGPSYNRYDPRSITEYRKWEAKLNGYVFIERSKSKQPTIRNFDDMLNFVRASDFSLIKADYRGYFKLFHNQFLYAYSNQCAAVVPNSVTIEFQSIETTVDGYGNELSSVETGPPEYITLEKRLEPRFMLYKRTNRARVIQDIFSEALSSRQAGKGNQGISATIGQLMEDRKRLNRFVAEGCRSEDVQTVYRNLTMIDPIH